MVLLLFVLGLVVVPIGRTTTSYHRTAFPGPPLWQRRSRSWEACLYPVVGEKKPETIQEEGKSVRREGRKTGRWNVDPTTTQNLYRHGVGPMIFLGTRKDRLKGPSVNERMESKIDRAEIEFGW